MVQVLGRITSLNVQKVMWYCEEIGCPADRIDVGGPYGGADTAEYLAKNPNGTIPTLVDGDVVVWESNTIIRYLGEAYGSDPWYPSDLRRRAQANQWMDWTMGVLTPLMRVLYVGLVQTPEQRRHRVQLKRAYEFHPGAVASALRHAATVWRRLDAHLADQAFVTGAEPTMGDVPPAAWVQRWYMLPAERPNLVNLRAWYDRLVERPAYRRHVASSPP